MKTRRNIIKPYQKTIEGIHNMRKKIIFGNWKMNTNAGEGMDIVMGLKDRVGKVEDVEIGVCPPYLYLAGLASMCQGSCIKVGAQNMYFEKKGAFTGQISAEMLKDIMVDWVILGHSEPRHTIGNLSGEPSFVGESDALINKKLKAALEGGLKVILCIGEMLHERNEGKTDEVNKKQLTKGLEDITAEQMADIVIAYEPVWAIGTGETATPEQAQQAHKFIRSVIADLYDNDVAEAVRIQYGGSVKPDNAKELLTQPDVDGALVGGASLKVDDFAGIIEAIL